MRGPRRGWDLGKGQRAPPYQLADPEQRCEGFTSLATMASPDTNFYLLNKSVSLLQRTFF